MSYTQMNNSAEQNVSDSGRIRQILLTKHIRDLSLPHSQPALYDTLHVLLSATEPLREEMEESLDQLKEAFLNVLYEIFEEGNINTVDRLILGLGEDRLQVMDRTHPQADAVDALLASVPMLAVVLRQIASDTLMLRSLNSLNRAFTLCQNASTAGQDDDVERYQVCLKGPLSHFYYA